MSPRAEPSKLPDTPADARGRVFRWLLAACLAFIAAVAAWTWQGASPLIDAEDTCLVALGQRVYARQCAACHGQRLEGQPNWRERRADGRMPAPPHDASGHTWHHPDAVLIGIVTEGLKPGKFAPPGYESDMPAYAGVLSEEEIRASLAYIKSTWPARERAYQEKLTRDAAQRAGAGR